MEILNNAKDDANSRETKWKKESPLRISKYFTVGAITYYELLGHIEGLCIMIDATSYIALLVVEVAKPAKKSVIV